MSKSNWFTALALPSLLLLFLAIGMSAGRHAGHSDADAAIAAVGGPIAQESAPFAPVVVPVLSATTTVAVEEDEAVPAAVSVEVEPSTETVAEASWAPTEREVCLAAAYALNPEWDPAYCDRMKADTEETQRRARCVAQREKVVAFGQTICATVEEETAREQLELLVPLAVMERESGGGRVRYEPGRRSFRVQTDICQMHLSSGRIVERGPGPREGTERMAWTFGDERRINRQVVRVVAEDADGGVTINTCVYGEEGLFQTLPREFRRGLVVRATGEALEGSKTERTEQVRADPVLQVRLGVQALVEHRDLWPEADRDPWWAWIASFNTGRAARGEHWCAYQRKVLRHYLDACEGSLPNASGIPIRLAVFWPGCLAARSAYDSWAYCEPFREED